MNVSIIYKLVKIIRNYLLANKFSSLLPNIMFALLCMDVLH